jgi:hypothetical protein
MRGATEKHYSIRRRKDDARLSATRNLQDKVRVTSRGFGIEKTHEGIGLFTP